MNPKKFIPLLAILLLIPGTVNAQEFFGEFLDRLKGMFIHDAQPRPLFKLENNFRFNDPNGMLWVVPEGTEVDGASIPQTFWSLIGGPFEGAYINASVIHDHYCDTKSRTAHDTHRNFYYGMRAANVPEWKASLMYWAVATFGPSWKIEKRIVMRQLCVEAPDNSTSCTTKPTLELSAVDLPVPDLGDPAVFAAAVSKTNAIARTLLTSNGTILDVTDSGKVKAGIEAIQNSSEQYREILASKDFANSPQKLGLLSQQTGTELADIKPWTGNRIPSINEAVLLTEKNLPHISRQTPFKVDQRGKHLLTKQIELKELETAVLIPKDNLYRQF